MLSLTVITMHTLIVLTLRTTSLLMPLTSLKDFKVENGKEFLKEMKAKRFVPDKKDVTKFIKGT